MSAPCQRQTVAPAAAGRLHGSWIIRRSRSPLELAFILTAMSLSLHSSSLSSTSHNRDL